MNYLLYSPRSQGWFTNTATYSSSIDEARKFTRDEALHFVKKQRDQAGYNLLPVRLEDLA